LTDLASWRWIFFINLPVALFALLLVPRLVAESRMVRKHRRPDYAGAIVGTGGLIAVVGGVLQAASHPWGSWDVLLPMFGGIALLGLMVWIEARSDAPLIPLEFFKNRTRVVTNVVTLPFSAAFFSYFFLMTLFEQQILSYSPLRGGLSYLPFGLSIGAGTGLGSALLLRVGVKPVLVAGLLGSAGGLLLTSGIDVHSSYASGVLLGMIALGLSAGLVFSALGNAALHEVTGQDSSLASGVQQAMQQVGGAIGLAVLVTFAVQYANGQLRDGVLPAIASTDGYVLAFRIGAIILAVASVLVLFLLERAIAPPRIANSAENQRGGGHDLVVRNVE
jgi:MFS family permease